MCPGQANTLFSGNARGCRLQVALRLRVTGHDIPMLCYAMRFPGREFVFLACFLTGSSNAQAPPSWEGEVVYHIFTRSFRDSNGDGKGDFKGITEGLAAIQRLGCTAIMLNPVVKSRVYHNYFADDMMATDPAYGTIGDFRAMV